MSKRAITPLFLDPDQPPEGRPGRVFPTSSSAGSTQSDNTAAGECLRICRSWCEAVVYGLAPFACLRSRLPQSAGQVPDASPK
jgi:hypothetical protein